ncbi:MAG: DUF952 domain-containing protein [Pseudomonadota bacterium]|nr:DUF952 domain-containing protein [Pseudomonadota bacterium]
MSAVAYKLVDRAEWEAARATGVYAGSAIDRADGYIHLSSAGQLAETARRHYAGRRDLILATVELGSLGSALRWEASRGGALFPHLYGPLPVTAATTERALSVGDDGTMLFEDGETGWP